MHVPTTNSESNDSADHRQAGMLSAPADDPTKLPNTDNRVKDNCAQIVDDLEQCIRDSYGAMLEHASLRREHGQRTVVEAHRCGSLLILAHDTADRREGGFKGVCERTAVSRSHAYELRAFARAYPEVSGTGHFASVAEAMRALPAPAPALPEVTPDSPELAARIAEMKRLQAECRRDRAEIERLQHATHELQVENRRLERIARRHGLIDATGKVIGE